MEAFTLIVSFPGGHVVAAACPFHCFFISGITDQPRIARRDRYDSGKKVSFPGRTKGMAERGE
jgi:hypothetical protein